MKNFYLFIVSIGIILLEIYAIHSGVDGKSLTAAVGSLAFIAGLMFPKKK